MLAIRRIVAGVVLSGEVCREPMSGSTDSRMIVRKAAGQESAQPIGRRAPIRGISYMTCVIHTGLARFVADWIIVQEEETAVVETCVNISVVGRPVLTSLDEDERVLN